MNTSDGTATPGRAPIDPTRVAGLLAAAGVHDVTVEHVGTTGSTITDLAARVSSGDGVDRTVLLAEEQVSGRGRMNRPWSSPAGSQFICSLLISPDRMDLDRVSELPLFIGVACAEAVREYGVPAVLKWPNDLQVIRDGVPRKLAGILVDAVSIDPLTVVPGIGLNLTLTSEEFLDAGLPGATSLVEEGVAVPDTAARERITATLLRHLLAVDDAWRQGGEAVQRLHGRYRELSSTVGTQVRAELPGGQRLTGTAVEFGGHGELVIETDGGTRHTVTAGDVVHLRPASGVNGN